MTAPQRSMSEIVETISSPGDSHDFREYSAAGVVRPVGRTVLHDHSRIIRMLNQNLDQSLKRGPLESRACCEQAKTAEEGLASEVQGTRSRVHSPKHVPGVVPRVRKQEVRKRAKRAMGREESLSPQRPREAQRKSRIVLAFALSVSLW